MTKKDYQKIANLIFEIGQSIESQAPCCVKTIDTFTLGFIKYAKEDNPRFDEDRFLKACNFTPYDKR